MLDGLSGLAWSGWLRGTRNNWILEGSLPLLYYVVVCKSRYKVLCT